MKKRISAICVAAILCGGLGESWPAGRAVFGQQAAGDAAEARRSKLFEGAATEDSTAVRSYLAQEPGELVVVLNNGLTLIIKEHHTSPVAAVRMYVKTGAIYEQEHLGTGISHLFEHLLHQGTTTTRTEDETQKIMLSIGNNSNAYTTTDHTCYYINTAAEHTNTAIDLLADFITNPIWPDNEFEREWQVVQRELELGDNEPGRQLYYAAMEALYTRSPARYRTIGYRTAIQALTKDDIVNYYKRMYVPDNVVVSVVGDFKVEEVLQRLQGAFKNFIRRPVQNVTLPEEPPVGSARTIVRTLETMEEVMFSLNFPTVRLTHEDLYPLDLLAFILATGDSSRLAVHVRDEGLARSVDCYSYTPAWGTGMFQVEGRTKVEQWPACRAEILKQLARVKSEPVTAAELAKAKRLKVADHIFGHQTAESVASSMGSSFLSSGDAHFDDHYTERLQQVTAEQIIAVANKYFNEDWLCTALVGPKGFSVSSEVAAQESIVKADVVEKQLGNGLRVLLKRDTSSPIVAMQFNLKGGQAGETAAEAGTHSMIGQLLTRGTATRSAQQISEFFDSIGGSISASGERHALGVSCQVLKEDLGEAFEVYADVIRNATLPEDQLAIFKPIVLSQIKSLKEQISQYTFDLLSQKFHPKSPYGHRQMGTIESVEGMSSEGLASFYRGRLCGQNAVLTIVGDIDPAGLFDRIESSFGSLPANPTRAMPEPQRDPKLDRNEVYVAKSGQAAGMIFFAYRGPTIFDEDDLADLTMIDTIISGYGYPSGWLHTRLRGEGEGLTYAVHAFSAAGIVPRLFGAYANCQPEGVSKVFKIMDEELRRAGRGEFTQVELDESRNQVITNEKMSNQTVGEIATKYAANVVLGRPYDWDSPAQMEVQLKKVTVASMKATAKKYFTNYVAVITTPKPEEVDLGPGVEVVTLSDDVAQ
jgi:zinc protease